MQIFRKHAGKCCIECARANNWTDLVIIQDGEIPSVCQLCGAKAQPGYSMFHALTKVN